MINTCIHFVYVYVKKKANTHTIHTNFLNLSLDQDAASKKPKPSFSFACSLSSFFQHLFLIMADTYITYIMYRSLIMNNGDNSLFIFY